MSPNLPELLSTLKLRIPEDLGLVLPYPMAGFPNAMCASVNRLGLGEKASQVLSWLIESNERGIPPLPIAYTVAPLWNSGGTTRRVGPPLKMIYPNLELNESLA